ncbi:MAG: hypothetical protein U0U70_11515 [Chitinophagaceae bacterium]
MPGKNSPRFSKRKSLFLLVLLVLVSFQAPEAQGQKRKHGIWVLRSDSARQKVAALADSINKANRKRDSVSGAVTTVPRPISPAPSVKPAKSRSQLYAWAAGIVLLIVLPVLFYVYRKKRKG